MSFRYNDPNMYQAETVPRNFPYWSNIHLQKKVTRMYKSSLFQNKKNVFTRFSQKASYLTGTPYVFITALGVVITWAMTGPLFGFSDTWQLVINTSTTIITFLMVFLIQNTQNRDTAALQIKLDELVRVTENAHTALLDLEELDEKELKKIYARYKKLASLAREKIKKGETDIHIEELPE